MTAKLLRVLLDNPRYATEYDPDCDSPCRTSEPDAAGHIEWSPVAIKDPADLNPIIVVLGSPLHEDARGFRFGFFAGTVAGEHSGHPITLMIPWNREELDRSLREVAEHLRVQRDAGLTLTIPIANTDCDVFLSVNNATGAVVLQDFGRVDRIIAGSVGQFLDEFWAPAASQRRTTTG